MEMIIATHRQTSCSGIQLQLLWRAVRHNANPSRTCRVTLFTWTCVEKDGRKEVAPVCPKQCDSGTSFGSFDNGIIVICHSGDQLIKFCNREGFKAEQEEARAKLCPQR
jgi:hypothetical protein